jgi:hypothetical protein
MHRPGSLDALNTREDDGGDGDGDDTTTMDSDDGDGGDGNCGDGGDGNCGDDGDDRKRVSSWDSYSTQIDEPLQRLPRLPPAVGPLH